MWMKSGRFLAGCGVVVLLAIFTPAPAGAQVYEGKQIVKATLLADTTAVVPGKPLTVGLLLRIAAGWHTYWKFSGDAGLPTEIKWKLPPGWKIGEIEWPIPLKLKDPGDIVTYGYNDEVLLMQQITPPASVADTTVKLSAEASWLVCERICIPGSANLAVELPRSTTNEPANTELFSRYRKLLPHAGGGVEEWNRTSSEISLSFRDASLANYSFVDLYPLPGENALVGHPSVESRKGDEVTFKIPFENETPMRLRGLIVAGLSATDENRTGWYFEGGAGALAAANTQAPEAAKRRAVGTTASTAPATRSLATYLLFGFLGGFILNLMPCVLPVISLKIFGFVKQAGQHRRHIFRSGVLFVAGIFAWFIGLALLLIVLKAAGHQITWALQFTNPYFVLSLAALVTVFALNLLGVFEINPPETAMRLVGSVAREGDAGSFFHGVFATVLATPCTAPFLGTALGFAFAQSPLIILSMFVAIATGMSVPYLLLSAQPAWLRFLPKPGPWMERVKEFMGFLLLATLLFLLYVLGAQRGYEALIWAACFLLALGLACWMKGAFVVPTASTAQRAIVTALMVLLVVASAIYFIRGKFRSTSVAAAPSSIQQRLATELAQGHPVFVDFTAAWCITCKFNEKTVLDSADVREAFQRHGVTKLVADWTNGDPEITKLLQHFGRPGVPLYVLYPGRSGEPIVFPELITKSMILEKIETITVHVASQ
jgi:thiol:disulfide interchange protein/DsbC/DsbD-like thiol-disulfide interchange protein